MYTVTIYRGSVPDAHTSKILTGLFRLSRQKKIRLKFSLRKIPQLPDDLSLDRFSFWVNVKNQQKNYDKNIFFDMQDDADIHYPEFLNLCDVYYKRSYRTPNVKKLRSDIDYKIKPYGLNFACSDSRHKYLMRLKCSSILCSDIPISEKVKQLKQLFREYIHHPFAPPDNRNPFFSPLTLSRFESAPDTSLEPLILFQTRTWDPYAADWQVPDDTARLNYTRARIISALKKEFGERVVTGFCPDSFALKNYPEYITTEPCDKYSYLSLLHRSTICIQTTGLFGSTGWKLAEYFAAGKAIVTEPILDELPVPPEEKKNILTFHDPDECVAHCAHLLNHPELSAQMARNNYQYYLDEVEPSVHIYKCLVNA